MLSLLIKFQFPALLLKLKKYFYKYSPNSNVSKITMYLTWENCKELYYCVKLYSRVSYLDENYR